MKNKHQPPCSSCFILQVTGSSCFILQGSGSGSSCFILQGSGLIVFSSLSSLTNTIFTAADLSSNDTPPDIPACLKTTVRMRILQVFTDLIQKLYFSTQSTCLTVCILPASGQNNRDHSETELLPLRFNGVWQTNVCVLAPPAGLECEGRREIM